MKRLLLKLVTHIKTKFNNLTIMYKLNLCFAFIISLFIVSSAINFTYYRNDKNNSTLSVVSQNNYQTMTEIDSNLNNLSNFTKLPLFYDNINLSYIASDFSSPDNHNCLKSLEETNKASSTTFDMQNNIDYILESVFVLNKDLHSVFLFNTKGEGFYKIKSGSLYKSYNPSNEKWFSDSIKKFGLPTIIPTYVLPNISDSSKKVTYVYGVARGLVKYSDSKVVGIILINNDISVLDDIIHKALIYPKQEITLVNSSGYILYDTKASKITKTADKTKYGDLLNAANTSKHMKVNGMNCLVTSTTSSVSDWKLINIIPISELNKNVNTLQTKSYFFTLLFVVLSLFLILLLSKQIIEPVKHLSSVMKIVEKGDFDVKVNVKNNDEIGGLARAFNSMTQKINELINEVYINKIKQKDIELQMLQNQINPHFIYNTLESIHMMAEINDDEESAKMTTTLGSILRYGLSNKSKLVTVVDEIDNLKQYLMLQEIRFDNIENINIDIDSSLYNNEILKLTFQPIVENALYHGLNSMESGGKINITGCKIQDFMQFIISDNGCGMDEKQTYALNEYIIGLNNSFNSIGLKNVNSRIKLHYGSNYGIKIVSKIDIGTKVYITLPCKKHPSE